MKRVQRTCIRLAILVIAALYPTTVATAQLRPALEAPPPQQSQPNIVFIFTDDLGYGDIGVYGATDIATPNIDRIAAQGVMFTDAYAISPVCTPSRAGLLTGRYPIRMGIHHVFFPNSLKGMPEAEITIAEILKSAGYKTAISGKWHLGHREVFLPLNQGFDEFFGIPYSNDMSPLPLMKGNDFIEDEAEQTTLTQRITDHAVNFIDRSAGEPFFLYIPHPMPHVPLHTSEAFAGVSARGKYGDVIAEIDFSVGQIIDALERNRLIENTLLVFTSDNGPWLFMGEGGGSAGILRNGKGTTFDGGMKVPMVAMMPGIIPAGSVRETPISLIDWMPTIAELADAELPTDRVIDGVTLLPVLSGTRNTAPIERPLAFYSRGNLEAIRVGDWKLKRAYTGEGNPVPDFLRPFFKGEVGLAPHGTLLFNVREDPGETRNLASKHPEKVAELEAALVKFESDLGAPPPSITTVSTAISPPIAILISTAIKLGIAVLAVLFLLVASIAFWLGRRSKRRV